MKIAHICTIAGSHTILLDKLSHLKDKGYSIDIISSKAGYKKEFADKYDINIKFIEMKRNINLIKDLKSIIDLYKLIKKENYEIVHTHTAKAGMIGRIAAQLASTPLVIHTSHGLPFYEEQSKIKYNTYKSLEKIASYFCDAISSQNKEDIKKIKDYAPSKKVFYEGNGVNWNRLINEYDNIDEVDIENLKNNLNIDTGKKIILVGARLEPVKNHKFLINSLKKYNHKYNSNEYICLLAGSGPLKDELQKMIKIQGLERNIRLLGRRNDIFKFIKMADVVALTSIKEGIPRIIMESMSFAKPIIATDVLGTRELVQNDKSGYLINLGDEKDFAEKLKKLLSSKDLRKKFGDSGKSIIKNNFTEEIVSDRINNIYKELLR